MLAFKGFNSRLQATMGKGTFQFEPGKTYEEKECKCARNGFHCAENPLCVLSYYGGMEDRFFLVEAAGDINQDGKDSRISCTKLTLKKEISRKELAVCACKYMLDHPEREMESDHAVWDKGRCTKKGDFIIVRGKHPEAAGVENEESRESKAQGEACADSEPTGEPSDDPEPADEALGAVYGAGEDSAGGGADGEVGTGAAPVQPESEQLKGQMNIQDFPEYMPKAEQDGQENIAGAAGVEGEAEKPEKIRTEEKTEAAAGVTDAGAGIKDSDGMHQHIENQKKIIKERLQAMGSRCDEGDWDGLIETAKEIITRAESIKNMVEVWNG